MGGVARRQFLIAAGATLAAPLALGRAPHRIGLLPDYVGAYLAWLQEAARRHGWREGRDFVLLQPAGLLFGAPRRPSGSRCLRGCCCRPTG